jgi:3-hydroxyacyl-CoA dehydrogenase
VSELVRFEVEDGIGVITVDNPPVNALSPGVPEGILDGVAKGNKDPNVKAMVLIGAGRSFIAGADIRQFGKGAKRLGIGERPVDVLEKSEKPIVAAIHGFALGGGLETAMACNYRIAKASTKVGLPEVLIGLLPGGAGTQRLPRLIGPKIALDMITSGRHVPAAEAKGYGILDALVDDNRPAQARPSSLRQEHRRQAADAEGRQQDDDQVRRIQVPIRACSTSHAQERSPAARARGSLRRSTASPAVEAAVTLPFEQGIVRERELFAPLENSDASKGLRYAFFAERRGGPAPGAAGDREAEKDQDRGGGGRRHDGRRHRDELCRLRHSGEDPRRHPRGAGPRHAADPRQLRGQRQARQPEPGRHGQAPGADRAGDGFEAIGQCDAVIEAAFEEMPVKKELFLKIDAVMKPGALLLQHLGAGHRRDRARHP